MSSEAQVTENAEMQHTAMMLQYTTEVLKKSELLKNYDNQPLDVKRRVAALKNLQLTTINLDVEFHQKVCEIEREFEKQYQIIFDTRKQIVNGLYEPTDGECDFNINSDISGMFKNLNANLAENSDKFIKGIPNFWLTILKYFPMLYPIVTEKDEEVLQHLIDVRTVTKTDPHFSFVLEFEFSPNEYFSNNILTKEYFLKCCPDPEDYLAFDGPEIYKCAGCKIDWFDGKNLTVRTVKKKFSSGMEEVEKMLVKSFFDFFDPPEAPIESDPHFDEINDHLEKEFEVGHYLKERIIPRAVLFFTGESEEFSPDEVSTEATESDAGSELEDAHDDAEGDRL